MPDTLSQGGDREPSPWPRRVAAAVVLVVAAVLVVVHLPRSSHPGSAQSRPTATPTGPSGTGPSGAGASGAGPSGAGPSGAGPSGAGPPGVTVATGPEGITGPVLPWPGGLRLPATGPQPAWFSPGTGKTVPIGGLPPQSSGYQFIPVAGGWAIQADPNAPVGCGTCAGAPRAVYFLADHAQSVTRVGLAYAVAPGAAAPGAAGSDAAGSDAAGSGAAGSGAVGGLWLTSYPPDADPHTAAGTAREVSVGGASLGPQFRLPAGYVIERATDRGLLLAPVAPQPTATTYRLWDPAAPQASRTFDGVLAANATEIAWAPACAARCRVQVLNLTSGQQVTTELPDGRSGVNAAFSPDGRFLAVEESFSNEGDDGGLAVQLELMSVAGGSLSAVPGTWLSSDALISFGWPGGDDSLVAELGFTTKVQLMSWRPGASRLATALLRPRLNSGSLVIGQYGVMTLMTIAKCAALAADAIVC